MSPPAACVAPPVPPPVVIWPPRRTVEPVRSTAPPALVPAPVEVMLPVVNTPFAFSVTLPPVAADALLSPLVTIGPVVMLPEVVLMLTTPPFL